LASLLLLLLPAAAENLNLKKLVEKLRDKLA
jgi:hypothetical protein